MTEHHRMIVNGETILNKRDLKNECDKYNLLRKETTPFEYLILTQDRVPIGVIDCMPSNNGKYYAYRDGARFYMATAPMFRSFRQAMDWVIKDNYLR